MVQPLTAEINLVRSGMPKWPMCWQCGSRLAMGVYSIVPFKGYKEGERGDKVPDLGPPVVRLLCTDCGFSKIPAKPTVYSIDLLIWLHTDEGHQAPECSQGLTPTGEADIGQGSLYFQMECLKCGYSTSMKWTEVEHAKRFHTHVNHKHPSFKKRKPNGALAAATEQSTEPTPPTDDTAGTRWLSAHEPDLDL